MPLQEDVMHGHGVFAYADGAVYDGRFTGGSKNGNGVRQLRVRWGVVPTESFPFSMYKSPLAFPLCSFFLKKIQCGKGLRGVWKDAETGVRYVVYFDHNALVRKEPQVDLA